MIRTASSYEPQRLCSASYAAHLLKRPLTQIQMLAGANGIGRPYEAVGSARGRGTSDTRFYDEAVIQELARAPRHTKPDVLDLLKKGAFPNDTLVILRQRDPVACELYTEALEQGQDAVDACVRTWYGFDVAKDRANDPSLQLEQDQASRMWWPLAPKSRDQLNRTQNRNETIPCLISVGGLVLGAREILGIDHSLSPAGKGGTNWAFEVQRAGSWADPFIDTWLDSGAGKSILWWSIS